MIVRRLALSLLLWASLPALAGAPPPLAPKPRVEVIGHLIEAEFALQAGQMPDAAQHYLQAAQLADDVALAERATLIALAGGERELARTALARWLVLAPEAPAAHAQALAMALEDGEHETAMVEARFLLGRPGNDGWPQLLRALANARDDARIIARAVLSDLRLEPTMPAQLQPWLAFAGLARRLGDQASSDALVAEALRRFPDDPGARLLKASRLRASGDSEGARQLLVSVLSAPQSLSPALRRAAAQELADAGDRVRAAELLGKVNTSAEDYALRMTWLVGADDNLALAAFQRELLATDVAAVPMRALLLGHVSEGLGQWHEAESWYRQVTGERTSVAQQRLAWVLHKQSRDADALAVLRVLQQDEQVDGEPVREAFLMEAQLLASARRDADVLDAYRRGLAVFEDDPLLLYSRAMYQESQNRVDQALADLHRVIDRDGENASALNAYGYTLMERRQRYADALPYVEKAYALDAGSPAILDSIGWLRFRMGRLNDALPLLQKAWAGQKDAEIAAHLGEVLWQLDRKDEARAIWGEGWALEPGHPVLLPMRGRMR